MTFRDICLLSPEMSMAGLAAVLILVDLVFSKKSALTAIAFVGLAIPLTLSIVLWVDLNDQAVTQMDADFGTETVAFVVDKFSLFFKFLIVAIVALVVLASSEYADKFQRFRAEYFALILFSASGMMLLASTVELISIYVSLELTSLPLAALAAFLRDDKSAESGLKFLILSAISSAVLLYGMVLIYGFTGTTVLADIATQLGAIDLSADEAFGANVLLFGVVLVIAGFGFKIASVPFQMWAPDVYEGAPTPITAFLSVASKAAGFAVILRVFYVAFDSEMLSRDWAAVFAVLAILSMSFGNLVAILQTNIKRMLAYSTVAHAGYLMVGLSAVAARVPEAIAGPSGVLFYVSGYAATNLAAFAAIIAISNRVGSDRIDAFAGMSRRAPFLAGVLGFALVSLIGIPPTVGFMAKIYIFGAAVNANLEWLALAGVINSVISAYYYLRVIKVMYLQAPEDESHVSSGGMPLKIAIFVAMAGTGFFGIYPTPLINAARTAIGVLIS
ncbi:MAG: NADH-quinone oxidoreductase subunit N [SAR202 cluster bacterium]|jgi:NADH-quinone oxidoreductase subunit N|nr:NADH-quinone oxidoreductase subunit N [SAR202 cluster bacterium]